MATARYTILPMMFIAIACVIGCSDDDDPVAPVDPVDPSLESVVISPGSAVFAAIGILSGLQFGRARRQGLARAWLPLAAALEYPPEKRGTSVCVLTGGSIDADFDNGKSIQLPVHEGQVIYVPKGNTETAINRSKVRYREILIELKETKQS